MDCMQVTRWKPAVWDHLHYDVVRRRPLVRDQHPDLGAKHTQQNNTTQAHATSVKLLFNKLKTHDHNYNSVGTKKKK